MKHRPGEPCAVTSRMHGSAGGGWKRAVRQRAGRLPFTRGRVAGNTGKPPTIREVPSFLLETELIQFIL